MTQSVIPPTSTTNNPVNNTTAATKHNCCLRVSDQQQLETDIPINNTTTVAEIQSVAYYKEATRARTTRNLKPVMMKQTAQNQEGPEQLETQNLIMPPRKAPRTRTKTTPATETTTTTSITNAQLKALIEQGVADALAARDADRSINGDDNHNSRMGVRRTKHELALLYVRMFPEESDKIERYVGGLPDMIHESVVASKPKTMQDAIEMAIELMDKKTNTLAERQAENKRKLDNNNQAQQQPPKRQDVAQAYAVGTGEKKEYVGTLPLCNKCKIYHNGPCTKKCANCKKVDHLTRDCWNPTATNNQRTITCYECGNQGHYRSDCPEQKNQNHENLTGGTGTRGVVHALGGGETDQDLNTIEDENEA
ncbi:reverse transcriptase domain-containing protein [Tanacetum coccineum]